MEICLEAYFCNCFVAQKTEVLPKKISKKKKMKIERIKILYQQANENMRHHNRKQKLMYYFSVKTHYCVGADL